MMTSSYAIKGSELNTVFFGKHSAGRLGMHDALPGDLVCTYEALSTNPKIEKIVQFQKWIRMRPRGEFNKMFHFQIIVGKYQEKGVYEIAHVNGALGKITLQKDDVKAHHPGQAFLVFRAKDPKLREEIRKVACLAAREGNRQKASLLPFSFRDAVKKCHQIFLCFLFENFVGGVANSSLKTAAQLAVDFYDTKAFYNQERTEPLALSCPQFVANTLAVAKVFLACSSLLSSDILSRNQKIAAIDKKLIVFNGKEYPFHTCTSVLTSAYLVEALFKSQEHFFCAGYIGHIDSSIGKPRILEPEKILPISNRAVLELWPKKNGCHELNISFIRGVLHTLRILNNEGHLIVDVIRWDFKAKAAYSFFYKKAFNADLESGVPETFLQKFSKLKEAAIRDSVQANAKLNNDLSSNHLERQEQLDILLLEKKMIQESELERTVQTFHFSMNALAFRYLEFPPLGRLLKPILPKNIYRKWVEFKNRSHKQLEQDIRYVHLKANREKNGVS